MANEYLTPNSNPIPMRPTISGAGLDPLRADFRVEPTPVARNTGGSGFSSGLLIVVVFAIVAVMAAVIFTNRDMFGFGATDLPADAPVAMPADTTGGPIAPTPAPAPDEVPNPAPVQPAIPPVEVPAANP